MLLLLFSQIQFFLFTADKQKLSCFNGQLNTLLQIND